VPGGMEVPPARMALGVPAKVREGEVDPEMIQVACASYLARAKRFRAELRRIS
jgi:hypothetical protein